MEMETLMAELKEKIVRQLNLQEVAPSSIDDEQPLFAGGLGLDSIDALELIVLLQQDYNVKLDRPEDGPAVFHSVRTIAEFIRAQSQSQG